MQKTAIVTDSNSGITQSQAKALDIYVLPMPFNFGDQTFLEDINLTQKEFYQKLGEGADISTSQPSPESVLDLWDALLKDYEEVVHIPMSSGLSSSHDTAAMLASDYNGRVHVVNNQRISVTQQQSVLDAKKMANRGVAAKDIKAILEEDALDASIYIMVDTLKYLKKGGRVTPAAAMIGTVLNIKPVLTIQGEKLDAFEKARGVKQAKKAMIKAMKKDMDKRFAKERAAGIMGLHIAYTANDKEVIDGWIAEVKEAFPDFEVDAHPLSLSVACHIGPGALAIACEKKSAIS